MRLFMDPGDSILCEEYTYPHVPESLVLPVDYKSVKVEIDRFGIIPEKLEATLESMKAKGQTIPALLYTIPIGQNPTGDAGIPFSADGCKCCVEYPWNTASMFNG